LPKDLKDDYHLAMQNIVLSRGGPSQWFKVSLWGNLLHQEAMMNPLATPFHCRNAAKHLIILLCIFLLYLLSLP